MPTISSLVHETSTTTGTGNFTVAAVNARRRFSTAFGTGGTTNTCYYAILHRTVSEWEYGTGHMSDANTLVRDAVIASSNSNALVSFSAGTKDVLCDLPAEYQRAADRVGEFFWYTGDAPPAYAIELNGDDTISRTTYARLWAWVQTSGNLAASEGAKLNGEYGPGNGTTTFSLPDFYGENYFIRAGGTVGVAQGDQLQNHTHSYDKANANVAAQATLTDTGDYFWQHTVTQTNNGGSTGSFGSETRPSNISLLPCVCI